MIRKMLDLSTAHVSPAARLWLEGVCHLNALGKQESTFPNAGATLYGWSLYAPVASEGFELGLHPDLRAVALYARQNECDWILFDADGPELESLRLYGEEDDGKGWTDEEAAALAAAAESDDDDGGLHDELDEAPPPLAQPWPGIDMGDGVAHGGKIDDYLAKVAGPGGDGFVGVVPIKPGKFEIIGSSETGIHFTQSGRQKLDKAGHAVVGRSALNELIAAAKALLEMQPSESPAWSVTDNEFKDAKKRLAKAVDAVDGT